MQEEIHKRLHAPVLGPCACSQLRRLGRKLSSLYDTLLSPEDLTITQYWLLAKIERAGQIGHTVLAVALEFAKDNIRVNTVAPAGVATDMVDRHSGKEGPRARRLHGLASGGSSRHQRGNCGCRPLPVLRFRRVHHRIFTRSRWRLPGRVTNPLSAYPKCSLNLTARAYDRSGVYLQRQNRSHRRIGSKSPVNIQNMKLEPQESLDNIAASSGTRPWPKESDLPRRAFLTSDGVQLSYIRQGSGRPIVLLQGWSQCAEQFKHQIRPLSGRYDVIAVDQWSHGESQKVSYGLKISRLAKDLYELLEELDLNEVAVLGHSMGSSVIWCYIDLFGRERLSKIILVDQSPFLTSNPHWIEQELEDSGAIFTAQQLFEIVAALRSKEAENVTRQVIDRGMTEHAAPEMKEWLVQCPCILPGL
jgi:alpha/beta hydrolase fold